jgi:hypothetical protein
MEASIAPLYHFAMKVKKTTKVLKKGFEKQSGLGVVKNQDSTESPVNYHTTCTNLSLQINSVR